MPCAANYQYANVVLTDRSGQIRLTSGQLLGTPEFYKELTREVARSRGVVFKDRPRDATVAMPHFTLGVALKSDSGATIGTLTLGIDPWTSLYPTILKWPASSRSGEAILVRRDKDEVFYLSELRGELDSAMDLRDSLAKRTSPVVRAVLGQRDSRWYRRYWQCGVRLCQTGPGLRLVCCRQDRSRRGVRSVARQ